MSTSAIVVGAGIVGAAVADALAERGMTVRVLDASFPGSGATAAGMGHVVAMDDSPAQLALTVLSRALLDELSPDLAPGCELDRCGTLWIAEDDAELAEARQKVERLARAGVEASVLDGGALMEAEPCLRAGLVGAAYVPGDSVVYPPGLCACLLERATRSGATVLADTRVTRIDHHTVHTGTAVLTADVIVNAAGVAAPALTPGLDIVPRKGHLVITDRYPGFCRHQLVELGYMRSAHEMTGR
jgi:glycine/D-amino acid oxidase-like deaminating enzyme